MIILLVNHVNYHALTVHHYQYVQLVMIQLINQEHLVNVNQHIS